MNSCELKLRNQLLLLECELDRNKYKDKLAKRLDYQIMMTEEKLKEVEDGDR